MTFKLPEWRQSNNTASLCQFGSAHSIVVGRFGRLCHTAGPPGTLLKNQFIATKETRTQGNTKPTTTYTFTDLVTSLWLSGEDRELLFSQSRFHLRGDVLFHHNVLLEKPVAWFLEVNRVLAGIHAGDRSRRDATRLGLAGPAFVDRHEEHPRARRSRCDFNAASSRLSYLCSRRFI